jgi:hypothetical protein
MTRLKNLWIELEVLIVEHFNFEELKLIVILISFRMIIFFKHILYDTLLPCFQSHLACYSQVQKKKRSLPRLQFASL